MRDDANTYTCHTKDMGCNESAFLVGIPGYCMMNASSDLGLTNLTDADMSTNLEFVMVSH